MSKHSDSQFGNSPINAPSRSDRVDTQLTEVAFLIRALQNSETREQALLRLSKNRLIRENLAPLLWHSFGTITVLLQEILSAYRLLCTPYLTEKVSNRVCNALVLLQGVATHPDTKMLFINAKIPLYLHPFLDNSNQGRPHEYLRLTSLGIIGALVKADIGQVIHFILSSGIFPYFLHCMEIGTELTKTVAVYILNRVLSNDEGLKYCCSLAERFFAIGRVLGNMFEMLVEDRRLVEETSKRLLKHIILCYYRLSKNPRACDGLRCCLPIKLSDSSIINLIRDDEQAIEPLRQLFQNMANGYLSRTQTVGLSTGQLLGHLI